MSSNPDQSPQVSNVKAQSYFIARARALCPHCGAETVLSAVALGRGHEIRDEDSDDWQPVEANAFVFAVAAVSQPVSRRLRDLAPHLRLGSQEHSEESCWTNHCRHCGHSIEDDELHGEPGPHGFVLSSEAHAASVDLIEVHEPFEASAAGYAPEPEFFALMRRA
jgi:hypothetical protein